MGILHWLGLGRRETGSQGEDGERGRTCHGTFSLAEIRLTKEDKLGNIVQEILWCGSEYIIYRTCKGVFVHFSDRPKTERIQRQAFNQICPELCELRYLTHEMRRKWRLRNLWRRLLGRPVETASDAGVSLFEHNMAQAIMLLMEQDVEPAKGIAQEALKMAVRRCTSDNTIRYVTASVVTALLAAILLALPLVLAPAAETLSSYFVAALFGVAGAAFSVITRVRSFQVKPCQQSSMNYMMAVTRIAVGLIAGLMLYLVLVQPLGHAVFKESFFEDWKAVAVIGFVGGFAERLVPVVFQRTAAALEDSSGTPVQAARKREATGRALAPP